MKKIIIVILAVMLVLGVLSVAPYFIEHDGVTENAEIVIGESEIFEQSDFEESRDVILNEFKDYTSCELIRLVYDEEFSENEKKSSDYPDDVMVWYSDFQTGYGSAVNGFNDNSLYKEWKWTMCRSDDGQWVIRNYGLC